MLSLCVVNHHKNMIWIIWHNEFCQFHLRRRRFGFYMTCFVTWLHSWVKHDSFSDLFCSFPQTLRPLNSSIFLPLYLSPILLIPKSSYSKIFLFNICIQVCLLLRTCLLFFFILTADNVAAPEFSIFPYSELLLLLKFQKVRVVSCLRQSKWLARYCSAQECVRWQET